MIQISNLYKVNGRIVVADTIEDAIRIYKQHYKMQNQSDAVSIVEKISAFSPYVALNSDTALYEIKDE